MAVYLDIKKTKETPRVAEYQYSTTDGRYGYFSINLQSGDTAPLSYAVGEINGGLFARASHKVKKAWKEGGILPDELTWAS